MIKETILFTISDDDKEEALNIAKRFSDIGYNLLATEGTAKFLENNGLRVTAVGKINQSDYSVLDAIYKGDVDVVINTTSKDKDVTKDGFKIRRVASEQEIVCLTSLDTADALLKVLESISFNILTTLGVKYGLCKNFKIWKDNKSNFLYRTR